MLAKWKKRTQASCTTKEVERCERSLTEQVKKRSTNCTIHLSNTSRLSHTPQSLRFKLPNCLLYTAGRALFRPCLMCFVSFQFPSHLFHVTSYLFHFPSHPFHFLSYRCQLHSCLFHFPSMPCQLTWHRFYLTYARSQVFCCLNHVPSSANYVPLYRFFLPQLSIVFTRPSDAERHNGE